MRHKHFFILFCAFITLLTAPSSHACTTFCLDSNDALVVGKNFDWPIGDALVVVNKRNVAKTAWLNLDWTGEQPISWTSKYGSATINPWGREFSFSGMNEAGLVVSAMGLGTSEYPTPDARPAISANQWIQYQLDNYATVEDVIASDLKLRIGIEPWLLHFFVCDSTGACATIEFIDGQLVYHTQKTLPVKVLTNETYDICLDYWENNETPPPDPAEKIQRFITAAEMLESYDPATSGPAVDYTLYVLSNLTWKNQWMAPTQWSIAYDIPNRRINFYTLTNGDIRYFDMNSFDFSCLTPVSVLDIQENLSGEISGNFIDYTYEINRDMVEKGHVLWDLADEVLDYLAEYPETTECADACELYIKHKKIRAKKLSKPKKVVLKIKGGENFDIHGRIDLGPLTWQKKSFNTKKNSLKIKVLVPAGLEPGIILVSVGNCYGEIEIL